APVVVNGNGLATRTTTSTWKAAAAPGARVPSEHVRLRPTAVQRGSLADTKKNPNGSRSRATAPTSSTAAGLVTVRRELNCWPGTTGAADAVFTIVRSVSKGVCVVDEPSGPPLPSTGQLLPGDVTVPVLATDAASVNAPGGSTSVAGNGSAAWT